MGRAEPSPWRRPDSGQNLADRCSSWRQQGLWLHGPTANPAAPVAGKSEQPPLSSMVSCMTAVCSECCHSIGRMQAWMLGSRMLDVHPPKPMASMADTAITSRACSHVCWSPVQMAQCCPARCLWPTAGTHCGIGAEEAVGGLGQASNGPHGHRGIIDGLRNLVTSRHIPGGATAQTSTATSSDLMAIPRPSGPRPVHL